VSRSGWSRGERFTVRCYKACGCFKNSNIADFDIGSDMGFLSKPRIRRLRGQRSMAVTGWVLQDAEIASSPL
jgi:hypothetical protein